MAGTSENNTLQSKILALYEEGASDVEVASMLSLDKRRFMEMYEENPGFAQIVNIGRTKSEAWWNAVARRNLLSKGFQGSTWAFNMKNRYNWMDKTTVTDDASALPQDIGALQTELHNTIKAIERTSPAMARKLLQEASSESN